MIHSHGSGDYDFLAGDMSVGQELEEEEEEVEEAGGGLPQENSIIAVPIGFQSLLNSGRLSRNRVGAGNEDEVQGPPP
jgi:hypothetical protein